FLNDMGSDVVFSIWPVFVTLLGGNPFILGVVDGIGELIVNIAKGFSGFISDKIKRRKPFIWLGYIAGGTSRLLYGTSLSWHWLLPARALDRAGKIRGSPRDALIADVSSTTTRGRNFGILRSLDNIGALVGISVTLLFVMFILPFTYTIYSISLLDGLRLLFLMAAIPSFVGAIIIFTRIPEFRRAKDSMVLQIPQMHKTLVLFTVISMVFAFASFSFSLVTLYAGNYLIIPSINPVVGVPFAYLIFTIAASVSSMPMGKLSDRIGRRPSLILGYAFFAAMCTFFLFEPNSLLIVLALIFYGLSLGATIPIQRAFVSELSPPSLRASVLGFYQMAIGVVSLPSSAIAGFLWVVYGSSMPFLVSLILALICCVLIPFISEPVKRKKP
ncbi:MAG: MFS transporter, partial [Candidatus Ranarchaeia archaeon]